MHECLEHSYHYIEKTHGMLMYNIVDAPTVRTHIMTNFNLST